MAKRCAHCPSVVLRLRPCYVLTMLHAHAKHTFCCQHCCRRHAPLHSRRCLPGGEQYKSNDAAAFVNAIAYAMAADLNVEQFWMQHDAAV
jgi:hypothetical protein